MKNMFGKCMKKQKQLDQKIINMKVITLVFITYLLASCSFMNSQNIDIEKDKLCFDEKLTLLVLQENNLNREYFLKIESDEIIEYSIIYLGNIVNKENDTLRFVNLVRYSGYQEGARRGNGSFLIYDSNYKEIGRYYVGGASDVPDKVEGDSLYFNSSVQNEDCDQITAVGFKDSIPSEIFIGCTKEGEKSTGDIYSFSKK